MIERRGYTLELISTHSAVQWHHLLLGSDWLRQRHPHICNTLCYLLIRKRQCERKKLTASCPFVPTLLLSALFSQMTKPNRKNKSLFRRLRWESGGLYPSISVSRTSWLSLAKSCISIHNVCLDVRRVLTDYNLGTYKETASGSRGITALHLMRAQPKCQTQGSEVCCINITHCTPRTKCHLSFILRINSDRCILHEQL